MKLLRSCLETPVRYVTDDGWIGDEPITKIIIIIYFLDQQAKKETATLLIRGIIHHITVSARIITKTEINVTIERRYL